MLRIERIGDLAAALDTSPHQLYRIADHVDQHVAEFELHDPEKAKVRLVISPQGPLRRVQSALHRNVFRGRLRHSRFSYGGVPGRSARMNAGRHIESPFIYTTDLADFFPSIEWWRVEAIFVRDLGCSAEVGKLLARLCTYNGHLAQGLITSPLLADYAVRRTDARIAGVCRQHEMIFTRFVDDVSISGSFSLDRDQSGLVALVRRIVSEGGFEIAAHKEQSGRLNGSGISITGLQVTNNKLDVQASYVERLTAQLDRHHVYSHGHDLTGPLLTRDQLAGRIEYACGINPKWKGSLRPRLSAIDWTSVMSRAASEGLLASRRQLIKRSRATIK